MGLGDAPKREDPYRGARQGSSVGEVMSPKGTSTAVAQGSITEVPAKLSADVSRAGEQSEDSVSSEGGRGLRKSPADADEACRGTLPGSLENTEASCVEVVDIAVPEFLTEQLADLCAAGAHLVATLEAEQQLGSTEGAFTMDSVPRGQGTFTRDECK